MNRSCYAGRILRLVGILAVVAAVRAIGIPRATITDPVLRPLDQGAPPVLPARIRLS